MTGLVLALLAGLGVHYVYTAAVLGWPGGGLGPRSDRPGGQRFAEWRSRASDPTARRLLRAAATRAAAITVVTYLVLGAVVPALVLGGADAVRAPARTASRRRKVAAAARQEWPRMLEELRVLVGSAGRSIPTALFAVGARAPDALRPAFEEARREWLITTDFARTLHLLKQRLGDPTADVVCETLLVAHELGGSDIVQRIDRLIEDRTTDLTNRRNADARQSGARFARRFVLIVPLGMGLAGMSIGTGRTAYQTVGGQLAVVACLGLIAGCWMWAGRILHLPEDERVFPA